MLKPTLFDAMPGVSAGFTTRSFSGEEEPVEAARARLAIALGFEMFSSAEQVHGNAVSVVNDKGIVAGVDGLVTGVRSLLLTVVSADCALILLADLAAGVVGACHSGWRGTVGNIVGKTLAQMGDSGAEPSRIRAYVSPCISVDAFEVGAEVASEFPHTSVFRRDEWPRPHVDLKRTISEQLLSGGVIREHIEVDAACTATETDRFYSYRAENGTKGRMIGFIGLESTFVANDKSSR